LEVVAILLNLNQSSCQFIFLSIVAQTN